jgi:proteic killer suppression protein
MLDSLSLGAYVNYLLTFGQQVAYTPPMIKSIQSKALKRFWIKGDESGLKPEWRKKIKAVLTALETAEEPTELDAPGLGFHALTGDMKGRFALTVSYNWRITFGWDGKNATEIDLEDYHGR